jgi:KaiC/GvpD/RAD55 family RecA-like ATPase
MSRRKFLNARSPLRLLEKGLHGGLGIGNIGLVLAGKGVGKTPFLVGVALDEAMRGGGVLHVALDQTVAHVRAHYDAVFEEFAASKQIEDVALTHQEVDKQRSIRAYSPAGFSASKLREAVKLEAEAGNRPTVIVLEGADLASFDRDELAEVKALAGELAAEVWVSVTSETERIDALPAAVKSVEAVVSVILALEPDASGVKLRALKDHENTDLSALHVSLDPQTLLLVRS